MAIEKTSFNTNSNSDNADSVRNWLEINAADYFDSISGGGGSDDDTSETSAYIECCIGSTAKLTFDIGSESAGSLIIDTALGGHVGDSSGQIFNIGKGVTVPHFRYGIKTSCGIFLYGDARHDIFITKSDAGNTAVFARWAGADYEIPNTNSSGRIQPFVTADLWFAADMISSNKVIGTMIDLPISTSTTTAIANGIRDLQDTYNENFLSYSKTVPAGATSMANVCFVGSTYAPDLYVTPFSQYTGQVGTLTLNGVKYVYDGFVALRE